MCLLMDAIKQWGVCDGFSLDVLTTPTFNQAYLGKVIHIGLTEKRHED